MHTRTKHPSPTRLANDIARIGTSRGVVEEVGLRVRGEELLLKRLEFCKRISFYGSEPS